MLIEICDLCKKPVREQDKTEIIIKDFKGLSFLDDGTAVPCKRKFRGAICVECLTILRLNAKEKE